jgi:hypothetical protein
LTVAGLAMVQSSSPICATKRLRVGLAEAMP